MEQDDVATGEYDLEQDDDTTVEYDIVQLVISTINEIAEERNGPSFQDLIGLRIRGYAAFTNALMLTNSPSDVERVVHEHYEAKALNDKVQQYIKLAERGLVSIAPSEVIKTHINNPLVQMVSDEESGQMLIEWESEGLPEDFFEVTERVIVGAAAAQLLGGIQFWLTPDVYAPSNYALVHHISSTKH